MITDKELLDRVHLRLMSNRTRIKDLENKVFQLEQEILRLKKPKLIKD